MPPSPPVPGSAPVHRRLALAAALLVNLGLLATFHDRSWYPPDEGHYAHVAERLLDGEVLHRDVQEVHGGAVNFLNAAALAAFGPRLVSLRYPLVAAALLQAVVVFALLARRAPWLAAIAAVAATSLGLLQYLDPAPHWYCLLLFFTIAYALDRLPRTAPWRVEVLGFLVITTALFHQATGVLVGIGVATCLLLEGGDDPVPRGRRLLLARCLLAAMAVALAVLLSSATDLTGWGLFGIWPLLVLVASMGWVRQDNRALARLAGRLAAGGLAAALPLALYHAAHGSLGAWYEDAVLTAPALLDLPFLRRLDYASYLVGGGLAGVLAGTTPASVANGLYWMVLPLLGSLLGVRVLLGLRRSAAYPPPALALLAVFYGVVALRFQNSVYLAYSLPATTAGLLRLASGASPRRRALAGAGVAALTAVAIFFHAGQPSRRDAGELLSGVRLPLVETGSAVPRCGLAVDPRDLEEYTAALALIEREVPPEGTIFALPNHPELYFLSGRGNPFPFLNFALGVRTEGQARELLGEIARRPPGLIFYAGRDRYNTPLSRWTIEQLARSSEYVTTVGPWDVFRPRRQDRPPR